MRTWLLSHFTAIVRATLGAGTVALLALMSWGISQSNLLAAMISGAGLAVYIVLGGSSLLVPEELRSQATARTLRVASSTLKHMTDGLTAEGCMAVCQLLLPETTAAAISMTDTRTTLAYVGDDFSVQESDAPLPTSTRQVMESQRVQTFTTLEREEWLDATDASTASARRRILPAGIIAPLIVSERTIGTLRLYYRHGREVDRTQLAIARGLAELLSTQLSVWELDRQAELTARAEVKALQAQINPHFLFNTLNTIAAFTRTDPDKARELLREFSVFYRRTLEGSQSMIALSEELAQTRRYLKIEKARFGEDRIIETETVEKGCESVQVPSFLVQPIVENAVRHAMRDEGPLTIDVQVATDGEDVLIAVADDGLGMDESVAERLLEESSQTNKSQSRGTGIALRNVAARIERFFGQGSGVEIMSKPGEGTAVTLRLVGVAPRSSIVRKQIQNIE